MIERNNHLTKNKYLFIKVKISVYIQNLFD